MSTLTEALASTEPGAVRLQIVIDNQDAEDCPLHPFTMNVYTGDSRESWTLEDGSSCLVGHSIPDMLRTLADEIENGTVTR